MRIVLHQDQGEGFEPIAAEAAHALVTRKHDKVTVCLASRSGFHGKSTRIFAKTEIEALPDPSHSGATDYITVKLEEMGVPA